MSPLRSWQRALDATEQQAADIADRRNAEQGVSVVPPTRLNLAAIVAELLGANEFASCQAAVDQAVRVVTARAGRPLTAIESSRVALEMGVEFNARANAERERTRQALPRPARMSA